MNKTIITLLILILSVPAFAGGKTVKSDAEWLQAEYERLSAVKDPAKIKDVGLTIPGKHNNLYSYHPLGNCRIVFKDKSWVLLVSHSMHAEDGLGDLTLIRASDRKYYLNNGHVCDKLILESEEKITSLETFLKAKGRGSKGEPVEWEEYKVEQSPAGNGGANGQH